MSSIFFNNNYKSYNIHFQRYIILPLLISSPCPGDISSPLPVALSMSLPLFPPRPLPRQFQPLLPLPTTPWYCSPAARAHTSL